MGQRLFWGKRNLRSLFRLPLLILPVLIFLIHAGVAWAHNPVETAPESERRQEEESDVESLEEDNSGDVTSTEPMSGPTLADETFSNWHLHAPSFYQPLPDRWFFTNLTRLGVGFSRGNTRSLTVDGVNTFIVRRKRVTNSLEGGGIYTRGRAAGASTDSTTSRYLFAEDQISWEFYKHLYTYFETGWYTDRLRGIESSVRAEPGVGYFLIDSPRHSLSTEVGYDFDRENRVAPAADESIHSVAVGANYSFLITKTVVFSEEVDALLNAARAPDTRLKSQTELSIKILPHFGVAISLQLHFDNEPILGAKKLDTIQSTSLLFAF